MNGKNGSQSVQKVPHTKRVRVAVLGCGYWGPNLIRNFARLKSCEIVGVADPDPQRLDAVRWLCRGLQLFDSADMLINHPDVEALAIATPVSTHYALAKAALEKGKHVLVEKPMTVTASEAEQLVRLAEQAGRVLMVDHTFVYSGPVRKIRELIDARALGDIYYYDSVRVNLGLFQHETNVLWDLGPHDFSIMNYLVDARPVAVSAVGVCPVSLGRWSQMSVVYVTVQFESELLAHFHLNWLSPLKIRRTLIGGSQKMVVYDHLDPDNQVRIFDKGVEVRNAADVSRILVAYRSGDMLAPKVDQTEALETLGQHFIECIQTGQKPITSGESALHVVRLLEAAQLSLKRRGKVVKL